MPRVTYEMYMWRAHTHTFRAYLDPLCLTQFDVPFFGIEDSRHKVRCPAEGVGCRGLGMLHGRVEPVETFASTPGALRPQELKLQTLAPETLKPKNPIDPKTPKPS